MNAHIDGQIKEKQNKRQIKAKQRKKKQSCKGEKRQLLNYFCLNKLLANLSAKACLLDEDLYSGLSFHESWNGASGPQKRISIKLYFIPWVKNALLRIKGKL